MKLSELTYKDYFELSDSNKTDIELTFQYCILHPKNIFDLPVITKWTFENVRVLISNYHLWNDIQFMEYFSKLANITLEKFAQYPLIEILNFKKHIESEMQLIRNLESELEYKPTQIELAAGIESFNEFGYFTMYWELANEFIGNLDIVKNIDYMTCYVVLSYRKKFKDFSKNKQTLI